MHTILGFSPFVQIKAGDDEPPIFIAHGMGGKVQVSELAKHIRTEHPIYGIQAKGIDGMEEPLKRVEDMAMFYLDALEELHRGDSCILIGYSFGGLVALEMAQRLLESGKRVALLVLVDTFPHPRFMPVSWRLRLFGQRIRIHAHQMWQMRLPHALSYFVNGIDRRLHGAKAFTDAESLPNRLSLSFDQAALRVKHKAYLAYASYPPRFYPGKIKFVATEMKTFFPGDPAAIWSDLAAELEIEVIAGNHLNIVSTEFKGLASVLTRYIEDVTCERTT